MALIVAVTFGAVLLMGRAVRAQALPDAVAVPGEVIVLFENESQVVDVMALMDAGAADADAAASPLGLADADDPIALIRAFEPMASERLVGDVGNAIALSLTIDPESVDDLVAALAGIDGVHAQPNFVYTLADSPVSTMVATHLNDPRSAEQYYLGPLGNGRNPSGANVITAWNIARGARRSNVTVAVLDTGADLTHEDLRDGIRTDLAYDAANLHAGVADYNGHGTSTLGIIGATANNGRGIAGVATGAVAGLSGSSADVNLVPVNVFSEPNATSTADIVKGLGYLDSLIESHRVEDLRVVNMSVEFHPTLSHDDDAAVHRLITHLADDHDVLFVCSGGNGVDGRALTSPCYPSDYEECLSVTSLTRTGGNSVWSDYNGAKDVSAPGEHILTTSPNGYAFHSGTSFAAPIASGVAALMFSVDPELSHEEAIDLIRATAKPLPDLSANDHRGATGSAGALDAAAAVQAAIRAGAYVGSSIGNPGENAVVRSGDVQRLLNPYTGEHHYTLDPVECDGLARAGWIVEGVAWRAPAEGTPVYRLYNPSNADHHYTTSLTERSSLIARGWRNEGIAWMSATAGDGAVPVYRLYNRYQTRAGTHHYTTDPHEYATLPSTGWRQEGICWYGIT